ncbi:TIGR03546 family protein [Thalassomonas sp. M1454]|uniref:TIGR03546 family protein n=1 Tax=Thalassomonas sp. M1454 TaxID=2594477 RepID=UPI001180E2AD|nr:TIGR03546 family protein [Thalassomonas sp. M1454]TRX54557.1 TIGR03546 family protein [Thalassomonas sp. M1454]
MLTLLAKLFKALNSESSSRQIALAIALGMIVGLSPTLSLHNLVVLFIAFILRINLSAFFVAIAGFSLLSLGLAPIFSSIGEGLLTNIELNSLWQSLYQSNLMKSAHFHNTLTLGSLVSSLVLFIPMVFISRLLVERYRHHLKTFIEKFKVVQWLKGSKFYQVYQSITGTGSI